MANFGGNQDYRLRFATFLRKKAFNRNKTRFTGGMLIEFKVANYRSIRAQQTFSMIASNYSGELPQNLIPCDLPGMKGTRLVKAVAIYGANASGKSNIVAALRFLAQFVCESANRLEPGARTGTQAFKLDPACVDLPSKFEISAVIDGVRTLYGLELTAVRVTSEYLVKYPKGRPQVSFERDWDAAKGKYIWSKSTEHFKHDAALRDKTRENAAFVGVASQFAHEQAGMFSKWVKTQILQTLEFGENSQFGFISRIAIGREILRPELVEAAAEADLGICDATARKNQAEDIVKDVIRMYYRDHLAKEYAERELKRHSGAKSPIAETAWFKDNFGDVPEGLYTPELVHTGKNGNKVPLAFDDEESAGTRRYLELCAQLELAKSLGQLTIYDELEASLHPLLVATLLRRFLSSSASTAQLVFTTHNPLLLDQTLLRRDQIWFTEKDEEGATRLYPLTDYAPRKDESLVKGYLAGRYGGIPFIPEGLKIGYATAKEIKTKSDRKLELKNDPKKRQRSATVKR